MQFFNSKRDGVPPSKTTGKSNLNIMNHPLKWVEDEDSHWKLLNDSLLAKARTDRNAQIEVERNFHKANQSVVLSQMKKDKQNQL